MANHIEKGRIGEKIALEYIINKGYSILETNWTSGHKEIDIIAQENNDIVFIEVKTRGATSLKMVRECVGSKKQNNIISAANSYIKQYSVSLNARFDIIAIDIYQDNTYNIEHIESAYYPRICSRSKVR